MNKLQTTIEIGDFELDIEIEYDVSPGERRTWDYPGSPPVPELLDVTVKDAQAGVLPVEAIHQVARRHVEDHWKRFGDMCLEDAALRDEAAQDAAEEEKFERWRNGD